MGKTDYVVMGRLGAPFGIKGWMKLISYTDPPDNILAYRHFQVSRAGQLSQLEIDQSQAHGKTYIAHVKGCDDRDQTRLFTGSELMVVKESLPELEDDEFYWHQLTGLKVVNLQGEVLGQIDRMMETGANDVMVLAPTENSVDKEERLIPWLKNRVIREVDLNAGQILVDWDKTY